MQAGAAAGIGQVSCGDISLSAMEEEMEKRVEILAPAGSFESMKAAVAAGADAVYIGGSRFGARAFADNPDEDKLLEAIDYVHLHGRRLYLTVNTLVKEREMEDLIPYLTPCYERGLDAVIVQDMGVLLAVREHFPDLPVHASTQMTITGPLSAKMMLQMGVSRIVTARELSLREIRAIYDETGAEIESFVHGALCYCYSGQCLFSSLIGGRSGNRGRCAQTCRLPFEVMRGGKAFNKKDERYILSLKDLCTLDILPDLLEAGVYSLKIEGRMKSPRYTAGVVSVYRKYVDLWLQYGREGCRVEQTDREELLELFDRGGQTDGYYKRKNGREMVVLREKPSFRKENRELNAFLDQNFVERELKEPVRGAAEVAEGKPVRLTLWKGGIHVCVTGAAAQTAQSQPMTKEKILKQLGKTGGTPFCFEELTVSQKGNPFVPVQELNELRRRGLQQLLEELLGQFRRGAPDTVRPAETFPGKTGKDDASVGTGREKTGGGMGGYRKTETAGLLTVSLERPEQFSAAVEEDSVGEICLDSASFDAELWKGWVSRCHERGKRCFLTLPHIFRMAANDYFSRRRDTFLEAGFDGVLVRDWGEIPWIREVDPSCLLVLDYGLYTMNRAAETMIREMAPGMECRFTLPVELNSRELAGRQPEGGGELIIYGRIPVMVTAQCVERTLGHCGEQPGILYLKDRMGKEFPVRNQCRFCYNTIYNAVPLSLLQEREAVERLRPGSLRLNFTVEGVELVRDVIRAFSAQYVIRAFSAQYLGEKPASSGRTSAGTPAGPREGARRAQGKSYGGFPGELFPGGFTKGHFKRGVE